MHRLGLAFLLLGFLAGCAEPSPALQPDPVAAPQAPVNHESVPPYWTFALDYVLPAGAELDWSWANGAGLPVPYRVMHVDANGSRVVYATTAVDSEDSIVVEQDGAYSLMWTNEGFETVELEFAVPEGYVVERWPPGKNGGCRAVALAPGQVPPGLCLVR